jgi:hypothetical protein
MINEQFLLGAEMQKTTKGYSTRTVQYISGATDTTSVQTETFTYDGEQKSFNVVFPVVSQPTIRVNGTLVPSSRIGVNGISDDNPNIVFSFSYNSQTIAYKSDSYMSAGATVVIRYQGQFPIRLASYNWDKINEIAAKTGTSGLREQVYIATDVKSIAAAQQLASSLLAQFENATEEISFYLLSDQLYALGLTLDNVAVLTQISIDLPQINISGTYVITERKLSPAWADMDNAAEKYKVQLKLMSRNYLRSYGEVLSDIRRDIAQLRVRGDEIVLENSNIIDYLPMTEATATGFALPHMCIGSVQYGSQFAQMSFGQPVYPTQ